MATPLTRLTRLFCLTLLAAGIFLTAPVGPATADEADAKSPDKSELTEQELAFVEQMESTVLVGFFTLIGQQVNADGKPERYEISKITKLKDNLWVFQSRVRYGKVDTVLPIVVPVEWAGDTPVVSMTDFTIPGMGTFSCRVLFDKDRYAGTWQHGNKGGHMWGKIEKAKTE